MQEYLDIGKIINTHGVKGDVKVIPFTDNPERYNKLKTICLEQDNCIKKLDIEGVKHSKGFVIVKFKEINDMNAAEALKDKIIKIDRSNAVKLPKNSYFIFDIIGCEVTEENGRVIGIVKDVLKTGSNDVYVVAGENNREVLVPALKSVVKEVSIEGKKIKVSLPKGLLDDEV